MSLMPADNRHDPLHDAATSPADDAAPTAPPAAERPREIEMTVRRRVNLRTFAILGVVVGALLAVILTYAFPEHPDFTRMQVLGFLLVFVTALTVVVFMIIALAINLVIGRERGRVTLTRVDDGE